MAERYYWTMAEIKIVREHYPIGGVNACRAHLPDRTEGAIHQQARGLGLWAPKGKKPAQPYATSPEIDRAIIECYQTRTERGAIKALAAKLLRPFWWVKKRAIALGIAQPATREPDWSAAEIELLRAHAHKNEHVIRRLFARHGFKRTATAIVVKRKRLQCDSTDPDHYTARQLSLEFGVDSSTITKWIERGLLKAKRRGTERTAVQGGDMWWIKRRDVRDFVADNAGAVDLRKVNKVWFIDLLVHP
jgi:hypothetical protein